tara:strand:+ start:329 stop:679 length:351 start_codon:yes stop_codon:yes gene_type:complete
MKNIIYQVIAKKDLTVKVPVYNKKDQVVGEELKHSQRTTLLGEYANRIVADFIKDNTFIKDFGKISVSGPLATSEISKEVRQTTERVNSHIHNSIEGTNWLKTYRKPFEEVIEYGD